MTREPAARICIVNNVSYRVPSEATLDDLLAVVQQLNPAFRDAVATVAANGTVIIQHCADAETEAA